MIDDLGLDRVVAAMLATQRHSWEQGIVMQALDALGAQAQMVALARAAVATTCVGDGRVGVLPGPDEGAATDPCACGIPLARAYALTGDGVFAKALEGLEEWALHRAPRNADGIVYHEISRPRIWVDSFFMLPPFLADRGHVGEALHQIRGYWGALHDPATGLLFHMWNAELGVEGDGSSGPGHSTQRDEKSRPEEPSPQPATKGKRPSGGLEWPNLWATGNGWALAGMAQVAERAGRPADRAEVAGLMETVLSGLARFQREDGLFHNMIDRPDTFVDAAGASLAAYAIFRGVGAGWLPERFGPMAARARAGVRGRIDAYGFVTGVPGAPRFEAPGISAEAQAAYLLMETAGQKFD